MNKNKTSQLNGIEDKLEYLGLDLEKIPKKLKKCDEIKFKIPKNYDENQYKVYGFVPINDIQILLSPVNRLDEISEKYRKSKPLSEYLDNENEENFDRYTTFLRMLKEVKIEDIDKIDDEQKKLNKKMPFKVKFQGNYLWQIYYSEQSDKYFMIVPTEESDYSTLFYLIKKQIENNPKDEIFVPIRNLQYSNTYYKKSEFEDVSNYLWLFTKDWPFIYETYNKKDEMSIVIVGETQVYEKIKSPYRIRIKSEKEAKQFYKLLKAMFILQTELPNYYTFETQISKNATIDFYHEDNLIEYENLPQWITDECKMGIPKNEVADELIVENRDKLKELKKIAEQQDIEYLAKEKQISTYLECKKTFFGKFKYYFKYSKSKNKNNKKDDNQIKKVEEKDEKEKIYKPKQYQEKEAYTIEELIEIYKEYQEKENELKNIIMDINALKLKNKNTKKKIENATAFIKEIDSHKRSIFEFWKYSNKDEVATLSEGEKEEVNIIKKIAKTFDYETDLEDYGKMMDEIQRRNLNKIETDSIYLTTTNVLEILNKLKNNEAQKKDIEQNLKQMKKESEEILGNEEFNIFGGISKESTKISKIANHKHREVPKDKFNILEISKATKTLGYKLALEQNLDTIKKALDKIVVPEDVPVYKVKTGEEKISPNDINVFNINPENELEQILKIDENKIKLYKFNLIRGINAISFTNIIFYDNQNKTLPIGQDISTNILVDMKKMKAKLFDKRLFKIIKFEDENDDFSNVKMKTIMLLEYDTEIK